MEDMWWFMDSWVVSKMGLGLNRKDSYSLRWRRSTLESEDTMNFFLKSRSWDVTGRIHASFLLVIPICKILLSFVTGDGTRGSEACLKCWVTWRCCNATLTGFYEVEHENSGWMASFVPLILLPFSSSFPGRRSVALQTPRLSSPVSPSLGPHPTWTDLLIIIVPLVTRQGESVHTLTPAFDRGRVIVIRCQTLTWGRLCSTEWVTRGLQTLPLTHIYFNTCPNSPQTQTRSFLTNQLLRKSWSSLELEYSHV